MKFDDVLMDYVLLKEHITAIDMQIEALQEKRKALEQNLAELMHWWPNEK